MQKLPPASLLFYFNNLDPQETKGKKGQKKGKIKPKIGSKRASHFYRNADFKPLLTISKHNDKPIYKNDGFITLALKH